MSWSRGVRLFWLGVILVAMASVMAPFTAPYVADANLP